jgi:hypothetical protein
MRKIIDHPEKVPFSCREIPYIVLEKMEEIDKKIMETMENHSLGVFAISVEMSTFVLKRKYMMDAFIQNFISNSSIWTNTKFSSWTIIPLSDRD